MIILSLEDIKYLEVDIFTFCTTNLLLLLTGDNVLNALISFSGLNIIYLRKSLAYADIVLITSCAYTLPNDLLGPFFIIISLLGMMFQYVTKAKKIPLMACITTAFAIINGLCQSCLFLQ